MPPEPIGPLELADLARRLGSALGSAERVGWGDSRATHRLRLADGRILAARRFEREDSGDRVERIGRIMTRLAEAGLPVPPPTIVRMPSVWWLVTAWVEGETGASWLGEPDRARHLAARMGRLVRRLRDVDLEGVDSRNEIAKDPKAPDERQRIAFVHGDYAPVNVIVDADGEIGGLLDFEHAGSGPALLDVAWWGWVVRHHHPEAWTAAWPEFLEAAGLEPGHLEAQLHELVLRTLADRAASSGSAEARGRWQERLSAARAWNVPDDQAT
jgi:aminoglycoside phosphotransferase (APT) family kinase protein